MKKSYKVVTKDRVLHGVDDWEFNEHGFIIFYYKELIVFVIPKDSLEEIVLIEAE